MQKIGCGSAIKVNFIALALHYLCNEQLKPFGKMTFIIWTLIILSALFGMPELSIILIILVVLSKLVKTNNKDDDDYSGYVT